MPRLFYVLICVGCTPPMTMPFPTYDERAEWLHAHRDGTGHVKFVLDEHELDVPEASLEE